MSTLFQVNIRFPRMNHKYCLPRGLSFIFESAVKLPRCSCSGELFLPKF